MNLKDMKKRALKSWFLKTLDRLESHVDYNPECLLEMCESLKAMIIPLSEDDFFGTEGFPFPDKD